jgi:SAM-dependent methyltransferase
MRGLLRKLGLLALIDGGRREKPAASGADTEAGMAESQTGQVTRSAAEVYEEFFVPALFLEWAPRVADAAQLAPGQTVLDVACGTGVLAREAARRVGPGGAVTGLDRNEGMLAVARRKAPAIDWRLGRAEALDLADAAMDAVVSQFGLMFFEDRRAALREMWRVVRPGGRIAVAVWAGLDRTPGYAAMAALLQRLFGERAAEALRAPFALGDPEALRAVFARAGIPGIELRTWDGMARFPSIESWVHTDVKGWTLADLIDDAQYGRLLRAAREELTGYVACDGTVAFPSPAHIATAAKP